MLCANIHILPAGKRGISPHLMGRFWLMALNCQSSSGIASLEEHHLVQGHIHLSGQLVSNDWLCLMTSSLKKNKKLRFVALANFYSVNTPTINHFRLLMLHPGMHIWEEMHTTAFPELVWARSNTPLCLPEVNLGQL